MKDNSESAAPTAATLLNDLHALLTEVEKMLADPAGAPTKAAVSALRARFDAAQDCLSGLYEGAKKNVADGARRTDAAVRANPYQALAIAAGIGLLIGLLAGRRTK